MLELSKEETLSNLYALRAGLSVITQGYDEVKKIEDEIVALNHQVSITKGEINMGMHGQELAIEKEKQKLEECKSKVNNITHELQRKKAERDDYMKRRYIPGVIIETVFLILFVVLLIVSLSMGFTSELGALFGILFFILIIFTIANTAKLSELIKLKQRIEQTEQALKEAQKGLRNQELAYQGKKERIKIQSNKYKTSLAYKEEEIALLVAPKQAAIVAEKEKYDPIYKALQTQFSPILDERDWGNIDLIIFNYETGRAETLKEALQQVDMERRNEELIDAIDYASSQISSAIYNSIQRLQVTMTSCFQRLNDNLQLSMRELGGQMRAQTAQLAQTAQTISSQLLDTQRLQTALIEKARVSSNQLMDDVRHFRELGDRYAVQAHLYR